MDAADAALAAAREALQQSDEPRAFTLRDDAWGEERIEATGLVDAWAQAERWVRAGDWDKGERTIGVRVQIEGEDGSSDSRTIPIRPEAPRAESDSV
jgi:hypothetical protein